MFRYLHLFILLTFGPSLWGQSQWPDDTLRRRVEIGFNITGTLAAFLNSDGITNSVDPYLISIKIAKKNALRFGFNLKSVHKTETPDFTTIETRENLFRGRVGFEKRMRMNKRCIVHWGVDALGEFSQENIRSGNEFTGIATLERNSVGFGGGPVLGFQFKVHPRIVLSTEAALYALVRYNNETQNVPPDPVVQRSFQDFELIPAAPSSLYLHIIF